MALNTFSTELDILTPISYSLQATNGNPTVANGLKPSLVSWYSSAILNFIFLNFSCHNVNINLSAQQYLQVGYVKPRFLQRLS